MEGCASRCCCCDGRLLVDQVQSHVLPRRLGRRSAWKLVYGGQTEEVQGDAFDVFQGLGQDKWARLRPWADGVEVYSRRRLVAVAGPSGLGTALTERSRLVAFDTACAAVACQQRRERGARPSMLTGTSCILRGSWSGMLASVQLVPSSWPTSAHWFAASDLKAVASSNRPEYCAQQKQLPP